jgi:shikimate dehydrogenase
MFAKQTGLDLDYSKAEVAPGDFEGFVGNFFAGGGNGLNITVPYKEDAFRLAQICSQRAELARAVNTLFCDAQNNLNADNTDGIGLVTDIKVNLGIALKDKRVLILGAGGAVRGVLSGLVVESPERVTVLNRTVSKAQQLQDEFAALLPMEVGSFSDSARDKYDLIINGTSMGLKGEAPPLSPESIGSDCCCYDLMYAAVDTAFVAWAKNNGAKVAVDGLGMLVEQAAESFSIWCKIRPETATVISELRKSMT